MGLLRNFDLKTSGQNCLDLKLRKVNIKPKISQTENHGALQWGVWAQFSISQATVVISNPAPVEEENIWTFWKNISPRDLPENIYRSSVYPELLHLNVLLLFIALSFLSVALYHRLRGYQDRWCQDRGCQDRWCQDRGCQDQGCQDRGLILATLQHRLVLEVQLATLASF